MPFDTRINALATRVATEFKTVYAALNDKVSRIEAGPTAVRHARDLVLWEHMGSNGVGDLVIQTNLPFGNHMTRLQIRGYNYLDATAIVDLDVAFYAFATGPGFVRTDAISRGSVPFSQVRLMRRTSDSTVAVVLTPATPSNYWQYTKIAVDGLFAHIAPSNAALSGWSASLMTSLTAYTAMTTVTPTQMVVEGDDRLATTGEIKLWPTLAAPSGYLLCDGTEKPVATYPALDALLGTTFGARTNGLGGAGSSHFRVPDFRGRSPLGVGTASPAVPGGTAHTLAQKGGEEQHTQTVPELATHAHPITVRTNATGFGDWNIAYSNGSGTPVNVSVGNQGSSTPFNVLNPFLGINFIIKT